MKRELGEGIGIESEAAAVQDERMSMGRKERPVSRVETLLLMVRSVQRAAEHLISGVPHNALVYQP